MDRTETLKIMATLKIAYPNYYKDGTMAEAAVNLYQRMFSQDNYDIVCAAVESYIASDTSGFPPAIGQIKDYIRKITHPNEISEYEAFVIVKKAAANAGYHYNEEFEKLPPVLKRIVGSSSTLREWALMDSETFNSVIASNFMRSYRAISKSQDDYARIPDHIKSISLGIVQALEGNRYDED